MRRSKKNTLWTSGSRAGSLSSKLGSEESTKILLTTLKAAEAKGRRKFVRASCEHDTISSLNVREGQLDVTGTLRDMSVVGFSCVLDPDPEFQKNTVLHDIQLRLRGTLVHTEAIVFGKREEERTTYVMLFTPRMEPLTRQKIRAYIQAALQFEIERIAEETPDVHLDFKEQEGKRLRGYGEQRLALGAGLVQTVIDLRPCRAGRYLLGGYTRAPRASRYSRADGSSHSRRRSSGRR